MAHKYEHVSTGGGYKVKNAGVETTVINQDGTIPVANGKILVGNASGKSAPVTPSGDLTMTNTGAFSLDETKIKYAEVTITPEQIVGNAAGSLNHASGTPLIPAPGAGKALELISAVLIYDYDTAQYGAGGNVTVDYAGGSAITGVVSNANSFAAAGDKVYNLPPLTTAGYSMPVNTGISLKTATAFTQPGTAAGVGRVKVSYRVHTHSL